jgi:hypothetical protein
MNMTSTDFIKFFEPIPEEKWCVGEFINTDGKCCALGLCGGRWREQTDESISLFNLFLAHGLYIERVNDGLYSKYNQPTPKQRILAALRDIDAKEREKHNQTKP